MSPGFQASIDLSFSSAYISTPAVPHRLNYFLFHLLVLAGGTSLLKKHTMATALPNGLVSHTDRASSELRRFDSVDTEDIAKLWRGRHHPPHAIGLILFQFVKCFAHLI